MFRKSQVLFWVFESTFSQHFYPYLHAIAHQKYTRYGYAHYYQLDMSRHL